MEELSIEEKAKRYDEALKAAVVAHKDEDKHLKATLERIFPELKDSEERVRKAIINVFASHKDYEVFFGASVEDILAWLKKQAEQKSIDNLTPQEAMDIAVAKCFEQGEQKPADNIEPIVVRDFNSVFSREQVEEIDKRIEESQRRYNVKLRDAMQKVEDFPMTD